MNAVAPGPIWTPLIPSTMPDDAVKDFGDRCLSSASATRRASDRLRDARRPTVHYTSGTTVAVTGGKPFI